MTIRDSRTLRNSLIIGGLVNTVSFFTTFGTSTTNSFPTLNYELKEFKGTVNSVSDLEDFSHFKKCNFLFYDNPGNKDPKVRDARNYLEGPDKGKVDEKKLLEKFEEVKEYCKENGFVYAKIG